MHSVALRFWPKEVETNKTGSFNNTPIGPCNATDQIFGIEGSRQNGLNPKPFILQPKLRLPTIL